MRSRFIFQHTLYYLSLEVGFVIAVVCKQCSVTKSYFSSGLHHASLSIL